MSSDWIEPTAAHHAIKVTQDQTAAGPEEAKYIVRTHGMRVPPSQLRQQK